MTTLRELFAGAPPEKLAAIEQALAVDEKTHTPWYIQALVVAGAWLASIFFIIFACLVVDWHIFGNENRAPIGVIGLILLVATLVGRRFVSGLFLAQCCLAFSLAAQGMLLFGFIPDSAGFGALAFTVTLLALALYFLFTDFLHRLVTTLAAIQLIYWWLTWTQLFPPGPPNMAIPGWRAVLLDLYFLLQLAGLLWCFLPVGRHDARRPLGYALLFSLVAMEVHPVFVLWFMDTVGESTPAGAKFVYPWYAYIGSVFTAGTLFVLAVWAAGGRPALDRSRPQWIAFGAFLGLFLFLQLGPVLLALLVILLGFSLQNRLALGLGVILFVFFLSHYYYSLQLDLMEKAGVLIVSGGLLLLLRGSLSRLMPKEAL